MPSEKNLMTSVSHVINIINVINSIMLSENNVNIFIKQ